MVSIDKTFKILALALGLGFLVYLTKGYLLPLFFALMIFLFSYPMYKWILKIIKSNFMAVLLSFIILILPIFVFFLFVYDQLLQIISTIPDIKSELIAGVVTLKNYISEILNIEISDLDAFSENMTKDLSGPLGFITSGINSTTNFLGNSFLTLFFTFFLLYYSRPFKNYIIAQFRPSMREEVANIMDTIKITVRAYVGGLGIVIVILAFLISLGLWIIGVEYAIFWGTLAGCLAVIPYIGTLIGGLLPFLYSLATYDYAWQPFLVVLLYTIIQQIEGNFITPKILGGKVNINPFFSILSLIVMGSIFGMGGVVLAIPILSIVRIVFSHFDPLKSTAVLLSTGLSKADTKFTDEFSDRKYSILYFFKKEEES